MADIPWAAGEGGLCLLDLFSCQGGAARGWQRSGFKVFGVDIGPQPRYCGDGFRQGDAVAFAQENAAWIRRTFAAVHASPPCQFGTKAWKIRKRHHLNLIPPTREALEDLGLPFVIENVEDVAPHLRDPVTLCGEMFGLRTYRHRLFECGNGFSFAPPAHPVHTHPQAKMGRPVRPGEYYHAVGNFSGVPMVREDMEMPWASRDGLREAVPPAYTAYIGGFLIKHLAGAGG
jgi:DNA (cytosine-5)-methyltransferase 1